MTKEESVLVLDSLSTWLGYERPITEEIVEAIKTISKPSFPSDLDDAAWEYFLKTYGIDNIAISEDIKRAVKFGAEWMAGQGETVEGDVEGNWRNQEDAPYEIYVTSDCLPKNTEFKFGDKVVVQIRKK